MSFEPYWDHKPTNAIHADSLGVYTSDKFLKLCTKDKIQLKSVVIDGSIQNGVQQPTLFSFVFDKEPGYKVFCQPETVHYKKNSICSEHYNISFRRW